MQQRQFDPNFGMTHFWLGRTYVQQSNFPQALAEFRAALSIMGDDPKVVSYVAYADALSGNTAEARRRLVQLEEQARQGYFPAFGLATINIGLGDIAVLAPLTVGSVCASRCKKGGYVRFNAQRRWRA